MQTHIQNEGGGIKGFIGILLLILGLILGGLGVYNIIVFQNPQYKISELLPQKNFEAVVFFEENIKKSKELDVIEKISGLEIPLFGAIAAYKYQEDFFFLSLQSFSEEVMQSAQKKNQYCEKVNNILLCSADKSIVLWVHDEINKKLPSVSQSDEYQKSMKEIEEDAPVKIFGKSSFLRSVIWEEYFYLLSEDLREQVVFSLDAFEASFPFFSARIEDGKIRESFFLSGENIFKLPSSLAQYDISPKFFPEEVTSYAYFARPDFLWEGIIQVLERENLAHAFLLESWAKKKVATYFGNDISFSKNILPLLGGNIVLLDTQNSGGVFFSLPSEAIAKDAFDSLIKPLEEKASSAFPTTAEYVLDSGEKIFEVFPDYENTTLLNQSDENGEYILYTSKDIELDENFSIGMIQKGSYFLVSSDKALLENFWDLSGERMSFLLPNKSGVIFSFGVENFSASKINKQSIIENKSKEELDTPIESEINTIVESDIKSDLEDTIEIDIKHLEMKAVQKENGVYFYAEVEY